MNDYTPTDKDIARFWAKVDKRGKDDCWLWTAALTSRGYGQILWGGKNKSAHRIAYVLGNGSIPSESHILHICDNPQCVNPKHLLAGTHTDNMRDSQKKGRAFVYPGEKHRLSSLTWDDVHEIRRLYATGIYNQIDIARKYGISHTTMHRIITHKTWKE